MTAKKQDVDAELVEVFHAWVEQQGGKETFLSRIRMDKLTELIATAGWETTLGELAEKAKEQGLLDGFNALTLEEMNGILNPRQKPGRRKGQADKGTKPKREGKGKRGQAALKILKYVEDNPNCKSAEISTGIKTKGITPQLQYLKSKGLITGKGNRRNMTYKISAAGKKYLEEKK